MSDYKYGKELTELDAKVQELMKEALHCRAKVALLVEFIKELADDYSPSEDAIMWIKRAKEMLLRIILM